MHSASPRLLALATAVPPIVITQGEVLGWAREFFAPRFPDFARLTGAFANAGIEQRHSCVPLDWYGGQHDWPERTRLFVTHALDLLERAARDCLDQAGLPADAVDAIVVASSTGIATPTLDAHLAGRLGLRADVVRLPIFGLGCAAGTLGLSRAAAMARAMPGAKVLFLAVELCGITFRSAEVSKSNVIATALFGDGCAAALISADDSADGPVLGASGEHLWPDSLEVMGWRVESDGLGVIFSRDIPALVRDKLGLPLDRFLERHGLKRTDLAGHVVHPGGTKVLAAFESLFAVQSGGLADARAVLGRFGNMSSATVLFVLRRMLDRGMAGPHLMTSMGPGFTAGFQMIEA